MREQEMLRVGGGPQAQMLQNEIAMFRKWIDGIKKYMLCYQTQLADPALLGSCVRYA